MNQSSFFEVKNLNNGIPVLFITYPDSETVTIGVTFHVGGRNENLSIDGISHFLEHQFFKGNEHLSSFMVNEKLDLLGGVSNAFTTEDTTCYLTKCLSAEIEPAINLWNELLSFGKISKEEFDKEAFVVKQEFRRFLDNPPFYLYTNIKSQLFKDTSLEMTVIGNEKTLNSISLQTMEDYRFKHYGLENSAIMILGGFDKENIFQKLNLTFGVRKIRKSKPQYPLTNYQQSTRSHMDGFIVKNESPFVFFGFGIKTPGGLSEDRLTIELLSSIFSLGRNSLLNKTLVRTGLASFAYADAEMHRDVGIFSIIVGTPVNTLEKANEKTFQMLYDFLNADITPSMLEKAIDQLEYRTMNLLEDPMSAMFNQSTSIWRNGRFISHEEDFKQLRTLTPKKFMTLRNKLFQHLDGIYGIIGDCKDFKPIFPNGTWDGNFVLSPKEISL